MIKQANAKNIARLSLIGRTSKAAAKSSNIPIVQRRVFKIFMSFFCILTYFLQPHINIIRCFYKKDFKNWRKSKKGTATLSLAGRCPLLHQR